MKYLSVSFVDYSPRLKSYSNETGDNDDVTARAERVKFHVAVCILSRVRL